MKRNYFLCQNCQKKISLSFFIGTKHRNHCPFCLFSKHVDLKEAGDRKSKCQGLMAPIGLTLKKEGKDRYGKIKEGEIMIIHRCLKCGKISINRIARDDDEKMILKIFKKSQKEELKEKLKEINIDLLSDEKKILKRLLGKTK
ncbi:MAG: RNHCP domain-containing protein [Minisyncoccales bacterium]